MALSTSGQGCVQLELSLLNRKYSGEFSIVESGVMQNRRFNIITARKRSLGQGNIFIGVCQEFCSQGGSTWAGTPPGQGTPPQEQTHPHPPGADTPQTRYTPLGTDTLPESRHPPGTTYTPPGTEQCWEIQSMRRRYASYWNAILFNEGFIACNLSGCHVDSTLIDMHKAPKPKVMAAHEGQTAKGEAIHTQLYNCPFPQEYQSTVWYETT